MWLKIAKAFTNRIENQPITTNILKSKYVIYDNLVYWLDWLYWLWLAMGILLLMIVMFC